MIYKNILECVGHTPLIRLNKVIDDNSADILVKFEGLNVGGSIKTRTALNMILDAEDKGLLHKDSIIVEATSGNQGIALAMIGAVKGYKVKIVLPSSVSYERRKLIKHYGAELIVVEDKGNIGECINDCLKMVKKLKEEDSNVFVSGQFENPANYLAQEEYTAKEILEDCKNVDGFVSGIGTGGTITGIGHALKKANPECEIWAIEPERAAILSGGPIRDHIQMGIGDGVIPKILDKDIYDEIFIVNDEDAIEMAKRLAKEEGIMCGISSGTNVVAAKALAKKLGKGKTVVTVLADTAERYFSTSLFDSE